MFPKQVFFPFLSTRYERQKQVAFHNYKACFSKCLHAISRKMRFFFYFVHDFFAGKVGFCGAGLRNCHLSETCGVVTFAICSLENIGKAKYFTAIFLNARTERIVRVSTPFVTNFFPFARRVVRSFLSNNCLLGETNSYFCELISRK